MTSYNIYQAGTWCFGIVASNYTLCKYIDFKRGESRRVDNMRLHLQMLDRRTWWQKQTNKLVVHPVKHLDAFNELNDCKIYE